MESAGHDARHAENGQRLTRSSRSPLCLPAARERKRDVVDTTQDMAPNLRVTPPAPIIPALHYPPPRYFFHPAVTAAGTPKSLYADAIPIVPAVYGVPRFHGVAYDASSRIGSSPDGDGAARIGGVIGGKPRRIGGGS
jgi:hypothetical protein